VDYFLQTGGATYRLECEQKENFVKIFAQQQRILQFMICADVGWTGTAFDISQIHRLIICKQDTLGKELSHIVNVTKHPYFRGLKINYTELTQGELKEEVTK